MRLDNQLFDVSAGRVVSDAIFTTKRQRMVSAACCDCSRYSIRRPQSETSSRRPLRFIDEENVLAVGDQLATKVRPYPARAAFDVYSLFQPGPLSAAGTTGRASASVISNLLPLDHRSGAGKPRAMGHAARRIAPQLAGELKSAKPCGLL